MSTLTPNYIDIDYSTNISRMKSLLAKSDTFKDYNFEGANFTILMELMAYLGELNTYYTNTLAKNIHNETADVYEVVHSLVRRQGYEPQGYMSGTVLANFNLNVTDNIKDTTGTNYEIRIPQWSNFKISSDDIKYTTTSSVAHIVDQSSVTYDGKYYKYSFPITLVQGEPIGVMKFNYSDITDNMLYISNDSWDFNVNNNSMEVMVDTNTSGTVVYKRVTDLEGYQNPSPYTYTFRYDKYNRYYIQFTSSLDIKQDDGVISVTCLRSKGKAGAIGPSTWSNIESPMFVPYILGDSITGIYITMNGINLTSDQVNITNSESSINNNDPDNIEDMKLGGNANIYTQLRNVTSEDYKNSLIGYSGISNALAWGEKEETMGLKGSVDTRNYNRVYISVVPDTWVSDINSGIVTGKLGWQQETNYYEGNIVYNKNNYINNFYICVTSGKSSSSMPGPSSTNKNDIVQDGTVEWKYLCKNQLSYSDEFISGSIYDLDSVTTVKLYSTIFKYDLENFLKPKKIIGVYEMLTLPQIVYFKYIIGFRVKSTYIWTAVKSDIQAKLVYYFSNSFRNFGDTIDSGDIINFIMDTTIISSTYDFPNIKGIQNLNIRNVVIFTPDNLNNTNIMNTTVSEAFENPFYVFNQKYENDASSQPVNEYPFYLNVGSVENNNTPLSYDNMMKPVKLAFKQYPVLSSDHCVYINEER